MKEDQDYGDYGWKNIGVDYSGDKNKGGVRVAKYSVFFLSKVSKLILRFFFIRMTSEQFCNSARHSKCPDQWLHLQLCSQKVHKWRKVLSSDQIQMPFGQKNKERLQNIQGSDQMWKRLHSDYQGLEKIAEERKEKEKGRNEKE